MNYPRVIDCSAVSLFRLLRVATSLLAALALACVTRAADTAGSGSISGSVSSAQTSKGLQGAVVSIPSLNRSVLTDEAGRFLITGVPGGSTEIVVTYTGFTDARQPVTIGAAGGQVDVQLKSSDLLTMEKFTVESVREGQALAVTEQRNAPNVKNVTAFDEWGILPTQNVGELVSRLPGITFTTDEDNLINNVSIGGLPAAYTRLNIDGMSSTGVGGDGRQATLHSFSASQYESVEIIGGQTPERRADSLGGQLNLKTASPLAQRDKRRVTYTMAGRWFPSWSKRQATIAERPLKPDVSLSYTEVFDVRGGTRNLGVMLSASYQEILNPHDWDTLLYESTTNPVAQLRDYTRTSGSNMRFISAFGLRTDYRWSPATRVSLRFLYNAGSEPFFNYTAVNPWMSANLTVNPDPSNPANTGVIRSGYTATRIEALPTTTTVNGNTGVGAAQMRLFPQKYSFTSTNPTGTLAFEHNWGRLKVDHAYRWSKTHWDSGAGRRREGGTVAMRTRGPVGFTLDYSDPQGRVFNQTAGASVYDAASYAAFTLVNANTTTQPVAQTSTVLTKRDTITDTNEVTANVNASYNFRSEVPISVKAGLDTVNRRVNNRQVYPRRWYMVPGGVVPTAGLMPLTEFERLNGGQRLPVVDPAAVSTTLGNTALWYEDVNFTATSQYTTRRLMEEGVDAAYVQANAKLWRFNVLGGLRSEWVATDTFTYAPRLNRTLITAEPDHFKRAALDYTRISRDGKYQKSFPSVHVVFDITQNLKARASWSTSYGRPTLAQLIAGVTPSAPTANPLTVTMGNPELKPQTGKNLDLKLEYYYDTGLVSVRGYKKKISDYIGSAGRSGELIADGPDNGFDGLYAGYEIIQARNLGDATFDGLEFDFRQRLAFLPGALKGLALRANYTYLETKGNYGAATSLTNGQLAGFVPRSYNVGLSYIYGKFGATFDVNYTGRWPVLNVSTTAPVGNRFREPWTVMNLGLSYRIFRDTTAFVNVSNLAEEGRKEYIFDEARTRSEWVIPRAVKFGVTGRF